MSQDPIRLLQEPDLPPELRDELRAMRDAAPPAIDYEAGLVALGAAIRGPGPGGAPPGGAPPAAPMAGGHGWVAALALSAAGLALLGAALLFFSASEELPSVDTTTVPALPPAPPEVLEAPSPPSPPLPAPTPSAAPDDAPDAPAATRGRASPEPPGDALRREMVLVEQMRRALEHEPARALELARQADREVGRGTFGSEREAIRVLALFALGRDAQARALAIPLLEREPEGLYAERIRRAMAGRGR